MCASHDRNMSNALPCPCALKSPHKPIMSATCVTRERCGAGSACTPPPHEPRFLLRSSRFQKEPAARGCTQCAVQPVRK